MATSYIETIDQFDFPDYPPKEISPSQTPNALVQATIPEYDLQHRPKTTPSSLISKVKRLLLKPLIEATIGQAQVILETNAMYEQQGRYQEIIIAQATIRIPTLINLSCKAKSFQSLKQYLLEALLRRENSLTQQLFAKFREYLEQAIRKHPKNTLFLEHAAVSETPYPSSGLICSAFKGNPTLCKVEGEDDNWLLYLVEDFSFRFAIKDISLENNAITYALDVIAEPELKLGDARKGFQKGQFKKGELTSRTPKNYPITRLIIKDGKAIPLLQKRTTYDLQDCLKEKLLLT